MSRAGSVPFSGGAGKRARAEYHFTDTLTGQFQWDNENAATDGLPNLGLDLKLRWVQE